MQILLTGSIGLADPSHSGVELRILRSLMRFALSLTCSPGVQTIEWGKIQTAISC